MRALVLLLALQATAAADPALRYALDTLVYSDSDHVVVLSPQASLHAKLDDAGGDVSARVVVDAISAASVDVISEATPKFTEVRTEVNLAAAKQFGPWLPSLHYRYSSEPDYHSNGFGGGVEKRLSPDTTVSATYDLKLDEVGRHGTPFSVWSKPLTTHTAEVGLTQVLGPRTLLRGIYTFTAQSGDMAKPYRYVPLFTADSLAAADAAGVRLGLANFDAYRLPERPPENVPDLRLRHALGVRLMRYLPSMDGSLRVDYRLYADSWLMTAHTLESELSEPVSDRFMFRVRGRIYGQNGASFYHRTYTVTEGQVPTYRSFDRDLGRLVTLAAGARVEHRLWALGSYLDVEGTWTRYFDFLLLDVRSALVVQAGLRYPP